MFQRDKKELAALGIIIDYDKDSPEDERGYVIVPEKRYLPELELTADEIFALGQLLAAVPPGIAFPMEADLRTALLKLSLSVDTESLMSGKTAAIVLDTGLPDDEHEKLDIIAEAVRRRKELSFTYHSPRNEQPERRRTLEPYHLFFKWGAWYLVGFCKDRKHVRTYRVGRMSEVRVNARRPEEPDFERPADFDPYPYSARQPWEFGEDAPVIVTMRFAARVADLAKRQFIDSSEVERLSDGSIVVHLPVKNVDAFLEVILAFGRDVEILAPEELRSKIFQQLCAVETLYEQTSCGT